MKVCDKIKFMRQAKELSQEQMAEKLGLSLNGYANIERGETNPPLQRIEQIAKVFEIDLMELLSFGERNVVFFVGNENSSPVNFNNVSHDSKSSSLAHELDKAHLEISYLKEIIELMKVAQSN